MKVRHVSLLGTVLTALILGGCGSDPTDVSSGADGTQTQVVSNKITGSVREWKVVVSAGTAEAGEVTFAIANFGSIPHEFLVVKTDIEDGKIPLGSDNRFSEGGQGLSVVDEISEFNVDTAGILKVNLEAGSYQLLCNIAGHYGNGMHVPFTVVAAKTPPASTTTTSTPIAQTTSNEITGSVKEWSVGISAGMAKAGVVNFTIENAGTVPHEFLVVRTDYAPGKIPLGADNRFSEEGAGIVVVDEISEFNPNTTGKLSVTLTPGTYQVLCNIAGHYANGMFAPLVVSS